MNRPTIIIMMFGVALLGFSSAATITNRALSEGLVDDATWRVHSKSNDHVTYVRREGLSDLLLPPKVDCNKTEEQDETTRTPIPTFSSLSWRGRGSASANSAWRQQSISQQQGHSHREPAGNLQLRAGSSSSDIGGTTRRRTDGTTTTQGVVVAGAAGGHNLIQVGGSPVSGTLVTRGVIVDGTEGDTLWKVTHRTDDHITYTKRNASSSSSTPGGEGQGSSVGQGQGQGELRRLGTGSDSVLARVVKTEQEDELTEESLLQGPQLGPRPPHSTNELVHPYVKRVNLSRTPASSSVLRSGGVTTTSRRRQLKTITSAAWPGGAVGGRVGVPSTPSPDHIPPRVGDELNGWRVVSKSGSHISWERVGSLHTSSSSSSATAGGGQLSLRSLDSSSSVGGISGGRDTAHRRSGGGGGRVQLIPSVEGELVEGFPRVFNTYSKSLFSRGGSELDGAGTIRTTLSNTQNWKVGDELAGWRVMSIDGQGLVWEKISDIESASWAASSHSQQQHLTTNEEDLLGGGVETMAGRGSSKLAAPLGTWYLDKETKNSVTWRRDGVPPGMPFDMEQYPRLGDTDNLGQWKVESKSREHITWVRLRPQPQSAEQAN